jgi:Tol biopolymer transport system component
VPEFEDGLRRELQRLSAPGDPTGVYEQVQGRKIRRRIIRKLEAAALAIIVLGGTTGGGYALTRAFGLGFDREPPPLRPGGSTPEGKIAFASDRSGTWDIYVMNADGRGVKALTDDPAKDLQPEWSPDGSRIAFVSDRSGDFEVHLIEADGRYLGQVTAGGGVDPGSQLAWSQDGRQIAFASATPGAPPIPCSLDRLCPDADLFVSQATLDGSSEAKVVALRTGPDLDPAWSPDSSRIAYLTLGMAPSPACPTGAPVPAPCPAAVFLGIETVTPEGDERTLLANPSGDAASPAWSPDGASIAFSMRGAIYVVPAAGGRSRALTPLKTTPGPAGETIGVGDEHPAWSPDGAWIAVDRQALRLRHLGTEETPLPSPASGGGPDIFLIRADGNREIRLTEGPGANVQPSWQPVLPGGERPPLPLESSIESPEPTDGTSSAGPSPGDACRDGRSQVIGEFDGDQNPDTAIVIPAECLVSGSPTEYDYVLEVEWGGEAGGVVGLLDCKTACRALAATDLNGDGVDEFVLLVDERASTRFVEVYELPASEAFGHHAATVLEPGAPGYPPGEPARFPLGGSVTHVDSLTCQASADGTWSVVATSAVLAEDESKLELHETVFVFDPKRIAPYGGFTVVSVRDYEVATDLHGRPPIPPGEPCWTET